MRLRTGLGVLPLGPGELQIGLDPRWAVRLTGLTEPETSALLAAGSGTPLPGTPPGVSRPRWAGLLEDLRTASLAHDVPARAPLTTGEADAQAWDLADPRRPGRERVAARRGRAVVVDGLGPTGLCLAVALAGAGVGTVAVADDTPVRAADVGPGGYRWTDVGAPRARVAARVLHDAAPAVTVAPPAGDPDLVVLIDTGAADPVRASCLVSAQIPHLSVVLGEAGATVGPLVGTHSGPCLHCLDLHRTDHDPRWSEVVTRLSTSRGRSVAEAGVTAGTAGHLAASLVLTYLDGDRRPVPTTWEITLPDPIPQARTWEPHPRCACSGQATSGRRRAGGEPIAVRTR